MIIFLFERALFFWGRISNGGPVAWMGSDGICTDMLWLLLWLHMTSTAQIEYATKE